MWCSILYNIESSKLRTRLIIQIAVVTWFIHHTKKSSYWKFVAEVYFFTPFSCWKPTSTADGAVNRYPRAAVYYSHNPTLWGLWRLNLRPTVNLSKALIYGFKGNILQISFLFFFIHFLFYFIFFFSLSFFSSSKSYRNRLEWESKNLFSGFPEVQRRELWRRFESFIAEEDRDSTRKLLRRIGQQSHTLCRLNTVILSVLCST